MSSQDLARSEPLYASNPNGPSAQPVLKVQHWTDRLFSFRITRPSSFRFRSGEFVMLGLENAGKPLLRAYSIASPSWDDELEFFSIKVPQGPLTSRLQTIQPGETVLLGKKPTGTLVLDALTPGKRLYMFSTGTGIAPFLSIARDPDTYAGYDQVILTHSCRYVAELAYGVERVKEIMDDPLIGEDAREKLVHYTSVTREPYKRVGRITKLIDEKTIFDDLGVAPLNPAEDRVMICGSMAMIADLRAVVEAAGLSEGSNSAPAEFVVEKAFVG